MFTKYSAIYSALDKKFESNSIDELKKVIVELMGESYVDYETAWIMEYNFLRRRCAQHYFSMRDKKWHRVKVSAVNYNSWSRGIEPFASIARWYIKISGNKAKQSKFIQEWMEKQN